MDLPQAAKKTSNWLVSLRGILLFILPLPLFPALFVALIRGNTTSTLAILSAMGLFFAGATLTRRGLAREAAPEKSVLNLSQRAPLKSIGATAVSLGTALCAFFVIEHSFFFSLILGLLTFAGYYLAYDLDPRYEAPPIPAHAGVAVDDLITTLAGAEKKVANIELASLDVPNPELKERLQRIVRLAREILTIIERDPGDLARARKFLHVYLDSTQRVSQGYARTHPHVNSQTLENNFRNVLTTIEEVFTEQKQRLLENDVLDLDIQIEVLSQQLKREGIT